MNNYYIDTIKSKTHESNQDRIFFKKIDDYVFLLGCFDGISSNRFSQYASQICKEVFLDNEYDDIIVEYPRDWLDFKLNLINGKFREFINGDQNKLGMGTTLNINLIAGNTLINFNIGDSRTYIVSGKKIKLISKDDNLYNWLKDNNIDPQAHKHQKFLHALTNCVEYKDDEKIQFSMNYYDLQKGDLVINCTDGFYKFFDFRKYDFSKVKDLEKFVDQVIDIAIENQKSINYYDDISLGVYIYGAKTNQ